VKLDAALGGAALKNAKLRKWEGGFRPNEGEANTDRLLA
jgi:hypothetical protein